MGSLSTGLNRGWGRLYPRVAVSIHLRVLKRRRVELISGSQFDLGAHFRTFCTPEVFFCSKSPDGFLVRKKSGRLLSLKFTLRGDQELFFVVDDDFCYSCCGISYFVRTEGLGYKHIRRGPDKVGFVGLFQPFRGAIKLFTKEQHFPLVSNYLIYYFSLVFVFSFFLYWFVY